MTGLFAPAIAERAISAMPMPAGYFNLVLRHYGTSASAVADLLAGTGIAAGDTEPRDEVLLWQTIQQIRNLARVASPGWALELGALLNNAAHGTLGVATASAATLEHALAVLERYAYLRAPYFRLDSETSGQWYRLHARRQIPLEDAVWTGLVELLLLSLQALVESALGHAMKGAAFDADYPTPPHAGLYSDVFHAPVTFGRQVSSLAIPLRWLPLACPFADTAQHRAALERLEGAERNLCGPRFIAAQVERVLESASGALPTLDEVATRLRLSRRTLVRRLEASGTSFRQLADALRKRRAAALLSDPSLSVGEVATHLGFTDLANFGRAARRWFGASPRGVRSTREPAALRR